MIFLLISRLLNAKSQMGYLDNEGHLTKAGIGPNVAATCCFHLLQTLEVEALPLAVDAL